MTSYTCFSLVRWVVRRASARSRPIIGKSPRIGRSLCRAVRETKAGFRLPRDLFSHYRFAKILVMRCSAFSPMSKDHTPLLFAPGKGAICTIKAWTHQIHLTLTIWYPNRMDIAFEVITASFHSKFYYKKKKLFTEKIKCWLKFSDFSLIVSLRLSLIQI